MNLLSSSLDFDPNAVRVVSNENTSSTGTFLGKQCCWVTACVLQCRLAGMPQRVSVVLLKPNLAGGHLTGFLPIQDMAAC